MSHKKKDENGEAFSIHNQEPIETWKDDWTSRKAETNFTKVSESKEQHQHITKLNAKKIEGLPHEHHKENHQHPIHHPHHPGELLKQQ